MIFPSKRVFFFLVMFLFLQAAGNPSRGQAVQPLHLNPGLVSWKSLLFTATSFSGSAKVEIVLGARDQPALPEQCRRCIDQARKSGVAAATETCLSTSTTIKPTFSVNSFYQTAVWFSPVNGGASRRLRLMKGKKYYLKNYLFTPAGVCRCRQRPANRKEKRLLPESWSDVREALYPFPGRVSTSIPVSESSLILYCLSAATPTPEARPMEIIVFHKKQYHLATLTRTAPIRIQVSYQEMRDGHERQVNEKDRVLEGYRLTSRPLAENNGQAVEEFSFMGLTGDIVIYRDPKSRLPVRIDGDLPFIGRVHFNLQQVVRTTDRR